MTEHLSFCRICAAACGMVVTIEGERVVRVRGDDDHPYSRGYVCAKARGLPAWHHSSARLDRPRVAGREVGWTDALDSLSGGLQAITTNAGPDAIAMYLATGFAYDAAGQVAAGMFMRGLRSTSFYSAATVDNAPVLVAAEMVTGNPMLNPVWDTEQPGLLLLVGTNPVVSHGYGTTLPDPIRRLRDYRTAGGRVWVLDPRRTETAALADEHLSVRPGSDVVLLAALARELLGDVEPDGGSIGCAPDDLRRLGRALAGFDLDAAADVAGVDARDLRRLLADLRAHRGRLAMFCGTGTTMAADGVLTEWLRWVLLVVTGSLDRPGGMRFNRGVVNRQRPPQPNGSSPAPAGPASRPDLGRVAGQMPSVALADEIERGHVEALIVTGGNPLAAFPEPARLRRALTSLKVLAVIDVVDTELTEIATHVLPATGQLERSDLTLAEHVSIRSGTQFTGPVVVPGEQRRPSWWMIMQLAKRLGFEVLPGLDPDDCTDDMFLGALLHGAPVDAATVFAAGPRGIDIPVEHGWVRETMLPGGIWGIAPELLLDRLAAHRPPRTDALVLVPRREMAWSNTIRYGLVHGDPARAPVVRLNDADAAQLGIADGDEVEVASDHGRVGARASIDPGVRPGVVSMTHGRAASPGWLTSAHDDVDPLTAMPLASGVRVRVQPLTAGGGAATSA